MGICFEHALLVADLDWRPTKERAEAIHSVLLNWCLVDPNTKPELFKIDGKHSKRVSGRTVLRSGEIPTEFVMVYPSMTGAHVRDVFGPYVNEDMEGFEGPGFWELKLILGRDFKILSGSEYGPAGAKLLSSSPIYDNSKSSPAGVVVPATWTTTMPETSFVIRDPMTGDLPEVLPELIRTFNGVWRSGLWIDFDKVYPGFHADGFGRGRKYGGLGQIPNRAFVSDLERAFDAELLEIGVYV
ncbi:MAG: hypothetical protein KF878_29320 [Planctomycetes bacterium]|nr:hypothetical protein [Planctomycetota bacterium]